MRAEDDAVGIVGVEPGDEVGQAVGPALALIDPVLALGLDSELGHLPLDVAERLFVAGRIERAPAEGELPRNIGERALAVPLRRIGGLGGTDRNPRQQQQPRECRPQGYCR